MITPTNLQLVAVEASAFLCMLAFPYCFGQVYDWWYARKKQHMLRGGSSGLSS